MKRIFDGRAIVELRGAHPVEAMRLLDAMPEVEKTSVFGTAVHAVVRRGTGGGGDIGSIVETLSQRLSAAGVPVLSASSVQPSLEDVFLEVASRPS